MNTRTLHVVRSLTDYEGRLRIAAIQAEVRTILADEAHSLVGDLKNALTHAEALADCPATSPALRDIARRQVATLRAEIDKLNVLVGRA